MLRNYIRTAIRNILKHKLLFGINLLGLVLGMATSMLLMNYVIFETSFDRFHSRMENIYRMISEPYKDGEAMDKSVPVPYTHGQLIAENYSEVEDYIRVRIPGGIAGLNTVYYQDREFTNDLIYFADEKFLKYFSFPLIKGNPETALTEIFSVVLTESSARKYFGDADPMDKSINFKSKINSYSCKVTGVMKDPPRNSSMKIDMLVSFKTYMYQDQNRLLNDPMRHSFTTYLVLKPGTDPVKLSESYGPFLISRMPEWYTQVINFKFTLQPLKDMHLFSNFLYDRNDVGNWKTVYFFFLISLIVLPICIINYLTFFAAQALERVRELGMRRVLGGTKAQILLQFIAEAFLTNLFAFVIAISLTFALSGTFSQLTEKNTPLIIFSDPYYVTWLIVILVGVSVLSGSYPALSLSSLKPANALSGKSTVRRKGGFGLRNGLTVVQFSVSIITIICTVVIYLQIRFMKSQDLGFAKDQVIVVKAPTDRDSVALLTRNSFLSEIKRNPDIVNATQSNSIPGNDAFDSDIFAWGSAHEHKAVLYALQVDPAFLKTYDFQFIAGHDFVEDAPSNKSSIVINEAAVKRLNFQSAEDALAHKLFNFYSIIGVVKNHRHLHFTKDYYPFVYSYDPSRFAYFSVRYIPGSEKAVRSFIEAKWKEFFPQEPMEFFYQDEFYGRQYQDDNSFNRIFGLTALLTIVLSCIGVFGLTYFDGVRRTKEIGIRRVLGAGINSLMVTLSKGTFFLVVTANLIGWPIAYYILNNWLSNYSARIPMPVWVYIVSLLGVAMLVFCTMSVQFLRTVKRNPVDSLRVE